MSEFIDFWKPTVAFGFLPTMLPVPNLETLPNWGWVSSIQNTVGHVDDDALSQIVNDLPRSDADQFESLNAREAESLFRFYSILAAHRIHRPSFRSDRRLPMQIAGPLLRLSGILRRPAALTYASYVLGNMCFLPEGRARADKFKVVCTPTGTTDEEWFVAVHQAVESAGGTVVAAIRQIESGIRDLAWGSIVDALEDVSSAMCFATEVVSTVGDRMDGEVFRNQIRPLLHGYENVVFDGFDGPVLKSYVGETGAQSGMIRAVDALLAPEHSAPMRKAMDRFLDCAPPAHQEFIRNTAVLGTELRLLQQKSPAIQAARHDALRQIGEFRKAHMEVVTSYLVRDGKQLAERGTGGTELTKWLQALIDETDAAAAAPIAAQRNSN